MSLPANSLLMAAPAPWLWDYNESLHPGKTNGPCHRYTPRLLALQAIVPSSNTNEVVAAATTPQEYAGPQADGVTDDSAAFQLALDAVYNSGGNGGGVVYVLAGTYALLHQYHHPDRSDAAMAIGRIDQGHRRPGRNNFQGLVTAPRARPMPRPFINTPPFPQPSVTLIFGIPIKIRRISPVIPLATRSGYGDVAIQNVVLVERLIREFRATALNSFCPQVIGTPLYSGRCPVDGAPLPISARRKIIRFSQYRPSGRRHC